MTAVFADIKEYLSQKNNKLFYGEELYCGLLKKYEKNALTEKNYSNGILHGIQKSYFPNGQLKKATLYTNGVENGRHIEYYECGSKKLNTNYVDGELDGLYEEWNPNGVLCTRKTFYRGKLIAVKAF